MMTKLQVIYLSLVLIIIFFLLGFNLGAGICKKQIDKKENVRIAGTLI